MKKIKGIFDVNMHPLEYSQESKHGVQIGRMSIDKSFHGDLSGTSKGEMLSAITGVKGSAGYVAIEQVTGQLEGREGSFVLQHFGVMDQGRSRLILEVVPDSATGEMKGLSGMMQIEIKGGQHFYEFEYGFEDDT